MLNRYLAKTLLRGPALKSTTFGMTKVGSASNNSLFKFSKMGFFDYDKNSNNLFSSDEEETTKRAPSQTRAQDNFFDSEGSQGDVLEGNLTPDDIPLYLYKMRDETSRLKRRERDVPAYITNFRKFSAMHHQNRDRIYAEFPRSSIVFYEYCAFRRYGNEKRFLQAIEDHIADEGISNMPIPGIKNFTIAATKLKRAREGIFNKLVDVLQYRQAYNDVRSNLIIMNNFSNLN